MRILAKKVRMRVLRRLSQVFLPPHAITRWCAMCRIINDQLVCKYIYIYMYFPQRKLLLSPFLLVSSNHFSFSVSVSFFIF